MTENDEGLIKKAITMKCDDWDLVAKMVKVADTPEAKDKLQDIAKKLYDQKNYGEDSAFKFEDYI